MTRVMVDSGIEWIGKIPDNWQISKVRKIFFRRKEINNVDNPEILTLSRDGVKIRDITTNEGQLAESYDKYHKVYKDDLLLNPMDLISGANCSISTVEGVISPAYVNLASKSDCCPRYYDYFFKNQYWVNAMFIHGKGVSFDNRWTINNETIMDYRIPIPPVEEQFKIASYLDKKNNQIKRIIDGNKKIIDLLEEYKKNYISEFFSELPDKKYIKLKLLCKRISKGETPKDMSTDVDDNYKYKFIKGENIVDHQIIEDNINYIDEDTYYKMKRSILEENDILFVIAGSIGKTAIVRKHNLPCNTNQAISFIRLKENDYYYSRYVEYFLNTNVISKSVNENTVESVLKNLSMEDLGNIRVPIIDSNKIKEVVELLDHKMKLINKAIKYRNQIVDNLDKYYKSIVYEVVTGKKEV